MRLSVDGVAEATRDFQDFLDVLNQGQKDVDSLQSALSDLDFSSLASDVSQLEGSFADLESSVGEVTGTLGDFESDLSGITSAVSDIGSGMDDLTGSIEGVGSSFEEVQSRAGQAQDAMEGLSSAGDELSTNLQSAQQNLDSLGPAFGDLASETDSAKVAVEELSTTFSSFDVEPAIGGITEFNTLSGEVVNTAQQAQDAIDGLVGSAGPLGNAFDTATSNTESYTGALSSMNEQTEASVGGLTQFNTLMDQTGTAAETAGGKFSLTNNQLVTLAGGLTGIVGAGTSAFQMWIQYESASTKVDAANVKLEQSNMRVEKAQAAYNAAVAQFGRDSPQAEAALAKLNLEVDKNGIAQDRAAQASDRFAVTLSNIAQNVLPTFLSGAGSVAAVIGTVTDKGSSGVSMLDRLKGAFTGAGDTAKTAVSGMDDLGASIATGGASAMSTGEKIGTLAAAVAGAGVAIAAAAAYWPTFNDGMMQAEEQARLTGSAISDQAAQSNVFMGALQGIDKTMRDLHPGTEQVTKDIQEQAQASRTAADTSAEHLTVLEQMTKANNVLDQSINETKDALASAAGQHEIYRTGVLSVIDATTQMQVKTLEAKGAFAELVTEIGNGVRIQAEYDQAYAQTNQKYAESIGQLGALAGEIQAVNDQYETGGRVLVQQIQGYADFNKSLNDTRDASNQALGAFEAFIDGLESGKVQLVEMEAAFAAGVKAAQDWFTELATAEEREQGFIAATKKIADTLGIEIPQSALQSEEALRRFFELMSEEKLDEIVRSWEEAGDEMIQGMVDGMNSNQSKITEEIAKIEEELNTRLTDPQKWQIKLNMDQAEIMKQLAEIEQDIGVSLSDEQKFRIIVKAQTEDLTQEIVNGINLAASIAEGDPADFVRLAGEHGTKMMEKISQTLGQLSPQAAQQLKPLLDALTAPPQEGETIGDRINKIQTALEALDPSLASSVEGLTGFKTNTAEASANAGAMGTATGEAAVKTDALKTAVDAVNASTNTMITAFQGVGNMIGGDQGVISKLEKAGTAVTTLKDKINTETNEMITAFQELVTEIKTAFEGEGAYGPFQIMATQFGNLMQNMPTLAGQLASGIVDAISTNLTERGAYGAWQIMTTQFGQMAQNMPTLASQLASGVNDAISTNLTERGAYGAWQIMATQFGQMAANMPTLASQLASGVADAISTNLTERGAYGAWQIMSTQFGQMAANMPTLAGQLASGVADAISANMTERGAYGAWQILSDQFGQLAANMPTLAGQLASGINDAIAANMEQRGAYGPWQILSTQFGQLAANMPTLAGQMASGVADAIANNMQQQGAYGPWQILSTQFGQLAQNMPTLAGQMASGVRDGISNSLQQGGAYGAWQVLSDQFGNLAQNMPTMAGQMASGVRDAISNSLQQGGAYGAWQSISDTFGNLAQNMPNLASQLGSSVSNGISQALQQGGQFGPFQVLINQAQAAAQQIQQIMAQATQQMGGMGGIGGTGYAPPYGANPYFNQFGFASGLGPTIIDHPTQMVVGESGAEMVFVAPVNNNRNGRNGELSPWAPVRRRFQAGTVTGALPVATMPGGTAGGNLLGITAAFIQMGQAAIRSSEASTKSLEMVKTTVDNTVIPSLMSIAPAYGQMTTEMLGTTNNMNNALLTIGQMINSGVIPPVENIGIQFMDASQLAGIAAGSMTTSFGQTGNYLQGQFIPIIGQGIPLAGNTAAQTIGQAGSAMNNAFGQVGSYLQNQLIPGINPAIPSAGSSAAQGVGTAGGSMQQSFNQVGQSVQGLLGQIGQLGPAAQQAAQQVGGAMQGMQGAMGGMGGMGGGGGMGGFGFGAPPGGGGFGIGDPFAGLGAPTFGFGAPPEGGGFGFGAPPGGMGFGIGDPFAGLGAPTFGLAGGLVPYIFNRPTRLTVGESGREMVYHARLQGGTNPLLQIGSMLKAGQYPAGYQMPDPSQLGLYTGGTPGGGLASYFPATQRPSGFGGGGPLGAYFTQPGMTTFGQNLFSGQFQMPTGTANWGLFGGGGNTMLGPQPAMYTSGNGYSPYSQFGLGMPSYGFGGGMGGLGGLFGGGGGMGGLGGMLGGLFGGGGGFNFQQIWQWLMPLLQQFMGGMGGGGFGGLGGLFGGMGGGGGWPALRMQGGTLGSYFPTGGGLTSFGQQLFSGGYPMTSGGNYSMFGGGGGTGGTSLGPYPAQYQTGSGYQPYSPYSGFGGTGGYGYPTGGMGGYPTGGMTGGFGTGGGYTGGGFGIGDPWAGIPMPNAGFGIGNPWAGIPSPFPYGGFGPGGYWPGTGQQFPQYPGGGGGFPTYPPTIPPTIPPVIPPSAPPPPPPPPIYSTAPGAGQARYFPAFRSGTDIMEEFLDLSSELPAIEAGLLKSYGSFTGIIPTTASAAGGGGGGDGGGGGGDGGGGGGGGGTRPPRPYRDIAEEIRRRLALHARARAGGGSNVLVGAGAASARELSNLIKDLVRAMQNMTMSVTLNNNIDGYKVNQALVKHQVKMLQTFV